MQALLKQSVRLGQLGLAIWKLCTVQILREHLGLEIYWNRYKYYGQFLFLGVHLKHLDLVVGRASHVQGNEEKEKVEKS